jgi:hypothetical protein
MEKRFLLFHYRGLSHHLHLSKTFLHASEVNCVISPNLEVLHILCIAKGFSLAYPWLAVDEGITWSGRYWMAFDNVIPVSTKLYMWFTGAREGLLQRFQNFNTLLPPPLKCFMNFTAPSTLINWNKRIWYKFQLMNNIFLNLADKKYADYSSEPVPVLSDE